MHSIRERTMAAIRQVTGMLLLGGSAVINALTGMNIYAASFLIPLGIILYTAIGGAPSPCSP